MYTASTALLETLADSGVEYIFANLGSDHPGLVEAMAESRSSGRRVPSLVTCPHEFVALSAAHGHALVSGRAQCVLVHVECGTQNLGGAVHNAHKGRVPVVILAGTSPSTQEGELRGSRNEFIHWLQDTPDQRGLVRGYMRYDNELRSGRNAAQILRRALQFAHSDPCGPVYLMAAREVFEEEVQPPVLDAAHWTALQPAALTEESAVRIAAALSAARSPLVITSYLGRRKRAVEALVALAHRLAIPVLESAPAAMNFPADDFHHLGCQWNEPVQNPALAEADVVLVVDSDVPWIPAVSRPRADAMIFHIDVDPLKDSTPLWYYPIGASFRADAATALRQVAAHAVPAAAVVAARANRLRAAHAARLDALAACERPDGEGITAGFLTAAVRARADEDTIVVSEGVSHYTQIHDHMRRTRPGTMLTSGASSLGWYGGAAIGAKLASPDRTVFALGGDGCFLFSQPATVHWMARQYRTPFLQVVYNNRGWRSPKLSLLGVHPDGYASRMNDIGNLFDPPPDHAAVAAAAGGAYAATVKRASELEAALDGAMHAITAEHRAAVLDVWLPPA